MQSIYAFKIKVTQVEGKIGEREAYKLTSSILHFLLHGWATNLKT